MPAIIILAGIIYALTPKSQAEQKEAREHLKTQSDKSISIGE